jgi:hypothetical protein
MFIALEITEHLYSLCILKQDRQCTHNVILRRVRESLLLWKSNVLYICLVCLSVRACSLAYPAYVRAIL